MDFEVRDVRPVEYTEAGRVTALAYREFVGPTESDLDAYLDRIADVAGRAQRTRVLISAEGDSILGSVTLEMSERAEGEGDPLPEHEAHVRMLGIHPGARRRGVARALMEACIEEARAAGKSLLTLNTTQRMKAAQAMYESMGFKREPDRVLPDGFCLFSYSLRLD